ncbi:uncharacterized protein LOC133815024 [Humulus lupulus]|uniref:uncharacterized protein LOC133815024 n=1 Tax=Humulus lupulus TaxID=3486 RepID=UPI002B417EE5|nr:uncharacterized protein LOC133815024 [Humulus lupulus]
MGGFNSVLSPSDRLHYHGNGSEMVPFQSCVEQCGLVDVKFSGNFFTWNNKQEGFSRVYAKLDRVMVNDQWLEKFPNDEAIFFPKGDFDHSPCLVIFSSEFETRKPFRYFNFWSSYTDFFDKLSVSWNEEVTGTLMYCLINKLKKLRGVLAKINKDGKGDVFVQDAKKYHKLMEIQGKIKETPGNTQLMNEEISCRVEYQHAHQNMIQFLKQKVKMEWLNQGDENTKVFHRCIRTRRIQNSLHSIWDMKGQWFDTQEGVTQAFQDYYTELLGSVSVGRKSVLDKVVQARKLVSVQQAKFLLKMYTKDEVKEALFSIPDEKAPGPDGCPKNGSDYRPIACCNVVYKIATKLICSRLREILPSIISENQSGFVQGRNIAQNIMICQDLARGYGRKSTSASCMIKIDLQKAYDTLDWNFLQEMMMALKFPSKFIKLVMVCVTTPRFSFMINGAQIRCLKSRRGLRQGDPLSHLLFVIGMEYLSRIMVSVAHHNDFNFHPRCEYLKLNHLCFADDLLLFSKGTFKAIHILLRGFQLFTDTSGLKANRSKSAIFCVGLNDGDWNRITDMIGFSRSNLPFKYLGMTISNTRITKADCECLVEKMVKRIRS